MHHLQQHGTGLGGTGILCCNAKLRLAVLRSCAARGRPWRFGEAGRRDLFSPSWASPLRFAPGPACGGPISFPTHLCSAHPWASPLRASRCGASLWRSKFVPDNIALGPSMGLAPARCALRGQPAAVQICSGQICRRRRQEAGGEHRRSRWPEGRGPWMDRVYGGFCLPSSLRQIRKRPSGPWRSVKNGRRDLFGPSLGLTPSRCALRGPPAAVQFVPDKFVFSPSWASPLRFAPGPACGGPISFRTKLSNPRVLIHFHSPDTQTPP